MRRPRLTAFLLPLLLSCDDRRSPAPTEANLDQTQKTENMGEGNRWQTFGTGTAEITRDPENGANIVLQVTIAPGQFAGVVRDLRRVKIWQLDHQLNFHHAFVAPKTCGGGSPRMQVAIDAEGDGDFDFNAHGHVRPGLNNGFTNCATATPAGNRHTPSLSTLQWEFEDLTDNQLRWEVTPATAVPGFTIGPAGGANTANWDALEAAISTALPNHQVLRLVLVEDAGVGTTYYDLISGFDLTLGTEGQWQPERRGANDPVELTTP
jgi:hypothetical protein